MSLLKVDNLCVGIGEEKIIENLSLEVEEGEVHAIMGPNGTGKSTLAGVLAGNDDYDILGGEVLYEGEDLLDMEVEERALAGLFLAFQYPSVLPGVSMMSFLREIVNAKRNHQGLENVDRLEFVKRVKELVSNVGMEDKMLQRNVNESFSGGEKKRHEMLQMMLLEPKMIIMDETDSGLDIDALRIVASGVEKMKNGERAILVITHYQRLLEHLVPDRVHVMIGGRIVDSGDKKLALHLEKYGYEEYAK